ncbi:response regulator transcription factor [Maritalea mobilis]|uniref:response regulator transcription factor n=1 Tax=Maritalea mobilis TaxID=483324 RepID=UPI001C959A46|nr:response regulator transcription factor [Maritalea mobilis]MBY6201028.1 response regulator transcription factor [Maritalea mobilis]
MAQADRVAILTGNTSPLIVEEALSQGAAGFIPKSLPAKSLINAIRFMHEGETYLPSAFLQAPIINSANFIREKLLPREYEVLQQVSLGKSNKEIANEFSISDATVQVHLKAIFRKLGVKNRTEAALMLSKATVE